jgi:hypothetical protein
VFHHPICVLHIYTIALYYYYYIALYQFYLIMSKQDLVSHTWKCDPTSPQMASLAIFDYRRFEQQCSKTVESEEVKSPLSSAVKETAQNVNDKQYAPFVGQDSVRHLRRM